MAIPHRLRQGAGALRVVEWLWRGVLPQKARLSAAESERLNELTPIARIDSARVRPVQSAASRGFIELGPPWQVAFMVSFGSQVGDEASSVEAFDSAIKA